jgi:hypothetical protein
VSLAGFLKILPPCMGQVSSRHELHTANTAFAASSTPGCDAEALCGIMASLLGLVSNIPDTVKELRLDDCRH